MDIKNFVPLIKNKKIEKKIKQIAREIDEKFGEEDVVLICVLKGAVVFYSKLLQYIKNKNVELDFIQVKSYVGTNSTGKVEMVKDCSINVENKNVVLVEDIIDTGITAKFLHEHFLNKKSKSVTMCSLIQKPEKLSVDLKMPLMVGFEIENKFIIGYGLDLDEKYRNLEDIMILKD